MTLVIYEPEGPALEFIGHAGAGLCGRDPVCAALSILMYTLIDAVPTAAVTSGDGYCRVDATGDSRLENRDSRGREMRIATASERTGLAMTGDADDPRSSNLKTQNSNAAQAAFDTVVGGLRLLAGSFPQYLRLEEKR